MSGHGEPKASERRIAAADKQRQALELKKAGLDYRAIAEKLGYKSSSGAHDAVRAGLKATLQEPADELRQLEVRRLDQMLLGVWAQAIKGDPQAIDRVLKIMDRRANLLGLDAPKKVVQRIDVNVHEVAAEVASEFGVPIESVIAEAERIVKQAAR